MNNTKYWGELENDESEIEQIPDVSVEIERSMGKFFLSEIGADDEPTKRVNHHISLPQMDPFIFHAIDLHKYANRMSEMIKLCEMNQSAAFNEDPKMVIPVMAKPERKCRPNSLNYIPKDMTDFTLGREVAMLDLKKTVVQQLLRKCIAVLFAHIGYESCQQSALDVLTDVLEDFFKTISHSFRVAIEDENTRQLDGFPHVFERVLTELGLDGVKGINDYYQNRVVKYVDVLRERCKNLNENYKTLSIPKSPPSPISDVNSVVRVKVEEEDVVEVENHEVHLADIEGADVSFSILEPGYQLLNSLEAEQNNLQSLPEEEDMAGQ